MAMKSFKQTGLYTECWRVMKKESKEMDKSIAEFVHAMIFETDAIRQLKNGKR